MFFLLIIQLVLSCLQKKLICSLDLFVEKLVFKFFFKINLKDLFSLPNSENDSFNKIFTFLSHIGNPVNNLISSKSDLSCFSITKTSLVYSYIYKNKPLISNQQKFSSPAT